MQRLVEPRPQQVEVGRFHPSEAIAPLLTCLRPMATHVHVDVPYHLVAIGRPVDTVQAVHNVLENARRYGGGSITVRATLEHDRVVLRISDRGPGVAVGERETIFERGVRGSSADGTTGSGLGLYISRELMRGQGGDLRLTPPDGAGGAAFEIVLPGFSTLLDGGAGAGDDQPLDLRDPRPGVAGCGWSSRGTMDRIVPLLSTGASTAGTWWPGRPRSAPLVMACPRRRR